MAEFKIIFDEDWEVEEPMEIPPGPYAPPETPHVLVILAQGEDYEIEHHPNCKRIERWRGVLDYDCLVAVASEDLDYASCDPNAEGWKHLPEGRYELVGWHEHTPSLPTNGGEEWDYGVHIGPRLDDNKEKDLE